MHCAMFHLAILLVLLLQAGSADALKANWVENDVPQGGFSKRNREREARRRGETYRDPYAYTSNRAYHSSRGGGAQRTQTAEIEDQQPQLELP